MSTFLVAVWTVLSAIIGRHAMFWGRMSLAIPPDSVTFREQQ